MLALIRGAGDIASGAAMRLWRCGIDVVMTDLDRPTAIRRTVAFSNAIVHGETTVEGLRAVRAENAAEAKKLLREGSLPVLADPECACREELAPDALVDAHTPFDSRGMGRTVWRRMMEDVNWLLKKWGFPIFVHLAVFGKPLRFCGLFRAAVQSAIPPSL